MSTSRNIVVYHGKMINRNVTNGNILDQEIYPVNYSEDVIVDVTKSDIQSFLIDKVGYTAAELSTKQDSDGQSTLSLKDVIMKLSTTAFNEIRIEDIEESIRNDMFTTGSDDEDQTRAVTLSTLSDVLKTVVRVNDKPMTDVPQLIYAPTDKAEGIPYFDTVTNGWVWGKVTDEEIASWNKAAQMTGRGRQEFEFSSLLGTILDRLNIPSSERSEYSLGDVVEFDDNIFTVLYTAPGYIEAYSVDKFGGSVRRVMAPVELDDDRDVGGATRFYIRKALDRGSYSLSYNQHMNPFKDTLMIFLGARVYVYDPLYRVFDCMFNWKPDTYHCIGSGWMVNGTTVEEVYIFWDDELYVWTTSMGDDSPSQYDDETAGNELNNWDSTGIIYAGQLSCSTGGTCQFGICADIGSSGSISQIVNIYQHSNGVGVSRIWSVDYLSRLIPYRDIHTGRFFARHWEFGTTQLRFVRNPVTPETIDHENELTGGPGSSYDEISFNQDRSYAVFELPNGGYISSDEFTNEVFPQDTITGVTSYWQAANFKVDDDYYELWYNDGYELPLRILKRTYNRYTPSSTEEMETNLAEIYELPYEQVHSVYTTTGGVFIQTPNDVLFAARGTLVTSVYVNTAINEAFKSVAEEVASSIADNKDTIDGAANNLSTALNQKLRNYATKDDVNTSISAKANSKSSVIVAPSGYRGTADYIIGSTQGINNWVDAICMAIANGFNSIIFLSGKYTAPSSTSIIDLGYYQTINVVGCGAVTFSLQYQTNFTASALHIKSGNYSSSIIFDNISFDIDSYGDVTTSVMIESDSSYGYTLPQSPVYIKPIIEIGSSSDYNNCPDTVLFRNGKMEFKNTYQHPIVSAILSWNYTWLRFIDYQVIYPIRYYTGSNSRYCYNWGWVQEIISVHNSSQLYMDESMINASVVEQYTTDMYNQYNNGQGCTCVNNSSYSSEKTSYFVRLRNSTINITGSCSGNAQVAAIGAAQYELLSSTVSLSGNDAKFQRTATYTYPSNTDDTYNINMMPDAGRIEDLTIVLSPNSLYGTLKTEIGILSAYVSGLRITGTDNRNMNTSRYKFVLNITHGKDIVFVNKPESLDILPYANLEVSYEDQCLLNGDINVNGSLQSNNEPVVTSKTGNNMGIHVTTDIDSIQDQISVGDIIFKISEDSN